jgi:tRNA (guanine-N7-)-methyltransferase
MLNAEHSSDIRTTGTVPWEAVFGSDRPVEIEIGPGRGETLLAAAAAAPDRSFFAIEYRERRTDPIESRAAARGLTNVRVITGDARCVITNLVPPASVHAYHIYFPDPWPKTRHRHRRLSDGRFAIALTRSLVRGGSVHVATDLSPLLTTMATALTASGLVRDERAVPPARPVTTYERRYARGTTYYARFFRP